MIAKFGQMHLSRILLLSSFVLAYFARTAPETTMPVDFHAALWVSIPLAFLWSAIFVFIALQFKKMALWMLLGAPLALYWPFWLLLHGIPSCYKLGNCV
jgi:hypothetical protein